jgi:hypothetical protein
MTVLGRYSTASKARLYAATSRGEQTRRLVVVVRNFKSNDLGEKFMQMMSKTEQLLVISDVMLIKAAPMVMAPPQHAKSLNRPSQGAASRQTDLRAGS